MKNIKKIPVIYLLFNKINQKIYIGKTINLKQRMTYYKNCKSNIRDKSYIKRAILKYQWENFEIFILEFCNNLSNKEIIKLETSYIQLFDATNRNIGYNILKASIGENGYKHTDEAKRKISLASKGHPGHNHSIQMRQKLKELYSIPIQQIDKNTNRIIKIWASAKEASRELGHKEQHTKITRMCKNIPFIVNGQPFHQKSVFGYKWKYVDAN